MKTGILLTAFGTRVPEARAVLGSVASPVREHFPDRVVRWAYTSGVVRRKLAEEGTFIDSPEAALARFAEEGFERIDLWSLHVIPGKEFHDLARTARGFHRAKHGLPEIRLTRPLLSSYEDLRRVVQCLLEGLPAERNPEEEAVLFMGHGSARHPADLVYAAMNFALEEEGGNVFAATTQGFPSLSQILPRLDRGRLRKVHLLPFMLTPGEHIRTDMAGDHPESWKSILEHRGLECSISLKGLAENPGVMEIWLDHLRNAQPLG